MAMSKAMRSLLGLAAVALACVNCAGLSKDDDLRDFHRMLDFDGDKYVSIKDMSEFAKKIVKGNGLGLDEELAVAKLMKKLDTNEDRFASLEEYLAYHEAAPEPWIPKQTAEFNAADTDGDGKLKSKELALLVFPPNVTALHVKADEDGDGHLSYDEMTADHVMTQFVDLFEMHDSLEILEGLLGPPTPDDIREEEEDEEL